MIIYLPTAVIFIYLLLRLIMPSKISTGKKVLFGLGLFLASQQHLIKGLFFGGLASPELPPTILMVQGWLFISVLFIFLLVLAKDITLLAGFLVKKMTRGDDGSFSAGRRRFLISGVAAIPAALTAKQAMAAGLLSIPAAYGVKQAVSVPVRRNLELHLSRLPKAMDGITLTHVTDLHVSPLLRKDWVQALVDEINGDRPDIILITGDVVDGMPVNRMESMLALKALRAEYGVFACPGNHEYYSDYQGWMRIFPDLGITMLNNEHITLPVNGHDLVVAGLADPVASRFNLAGPDLKKTLSGAPDDSVRILLDHRPGAASRNAAAGIDLQLSGHTHGGQLPGMAQITTLANNGFLYGWYQVNDMSMYVSSGAGLWSGFPIRLGVPAEIAHITLKCKTG